MSYHVTNSSHVIDHFLRMLRSLRYMCCVVCCWKSRLTPAVPVLEAWRRSVADWRYIQAFQNTATDSIHSYIPRSTCGSYRIVSRYIVWYHIVSIVYSYGCIVPSLVSSVYIFRSAVSRMITYINAWRHICYTPFTQFTQTHNVYKSSNSCFFSKSSVTTVNADFPQIGDFPYTIRKWGSVNMKAQLSK